MAAPDAMSGCAVKRSYMRSLSCLDGQRSVTKQFDTGIWTSPVRGYACEKTWMRDVRGRNEGRLIQKASEIFSGLTFWIRCAYASTTKNRVALRNIEVLLLSVSLYAPSIAV